MLLGSLGILCGLCACARKESNPGLVAWYTFHEGHGPEIRDQSRFHNDGWVQGPYAWGDQGLEIEGSSYVRIPSSDSLQLTHKFSVESWISGSAARLHFVEHPGDEVLSTVSSAERPGSVAQHSRKGPGWFQVAGDKIYLIYNVDIRDDQKNLWSPLWIGTLSTNLDSWDDHYTTTFGHEPKLQATANGVYAEYFAPDGIGIWQIWTAASGLNVAKLTLRQQTDRQPEFGVDDYGVEQEARIQVVGDRVYYAFPQKDEDNHWQLWTATANRDGSNFRADRRTNAGGWIARFQVADRNIYYAYPPEPGSSYTPETGINIAKSDLEGRNWQSIGRIENIAADEIQLVVSSGRLFLGYIERLSAHQVQFVTGSMDLEGGDLHWNEMPVKAAWLWPTGIQVVGDRVYYGVAIQGSEAKTIIFSCLRNGTGFRIETETDPKLKMMAPFVVVGSKTYYSASVSTQSPKLHMKQTIAMGTSGANIVSKGDSFGIGLSEKPEVVAFLNAGTDYLYRTDAPQDTGGFTARANLVPGSLHHIVATYDEHELILYVDGIEASRTSCSISPQMNNFPLVLGDGLVGRLKEVRIYNRALTGQEIEDLNQRAR